MLHLEDFRRKRSDECGFDDNACVREWIQPRPFSFNQSTSPSAHFYDVPIDNFISMLNVICCQYAAEKKTYVSLCFIIIDNDPIRHHCNDIVIFVRGITIRKKKMNMNHFATLSVFFCTWIFFLSLKSLTIINASFLNNYSFVIQNSYINLRD